MPRTAPSRVALAATEAYILGGFLAAMLYDTVGAG
jgi:hypothetical protein